MGLTKIDAAQAHLISAVRLHFQNCPAPSVYLLAASAREILTVVGGKAGVRTMLHGVAEDTGTPLEELIAAAHENVRFLKHADRDPEAVLENLSHDQVDLVLFVACNDFGRVANGQPIESQVYQAWWLAKHWEKVSEAPFRTQPVLRRCKQLFPGIGRADRTQRLALGWSKLQEVEKDPSLKMNIKREVVLPSKS